MIKLNICAARRPGMTQEAYSRYLRDDHARLVLATEPVSRHLLRYVQQHVRDAAYGAKAPPWRYDSVSHITATSLADQMAAVGTPEYKQIIQPDEANFADQRSPMFLMFEEQPLPLPVRGASPWRLLQYLRVKDGLSADDLMAAWNSAYEQRVLQDSGLARTLRRAVLHRAHPGPQGTPPAYTGMLELGFLQWSEAAAMSRLAERFEAALQPFIEPDTGFHLLTEAVAVRGSLD